MSDHYYFLVLPSLPTDGLQTYTIYSTGLNNWQNAQNCIGQGYIGLQGNPPPYSFFLSSDKAHTEAQRLSKLHQSPYYVARIVVMGQYIPPPPEWKPMYQEVWNVPTKVTGDCEKT